MPPAAADDDDDDDGRLPAPADDSPKPAVVLSDGDGAWMPLPAAAASPATAANTALPGREPAVLVAEIGGDRKKDDDDDAAEDDPDGCMAASVPCRASRSARRLGASTWAWRTCTHRDASWGVGARRTRARP